MPPPKKKAAPSFEWTDKLVLLICLLGILASIPIAVLGLPSVGIILPATAQIASIAMSSLGVIGIAKTFYENWPAGSALITGVLGGIGNLVSRAGSGIFKKIKKISKSKSAIHTTSQDDDEEELRLLEKAGERANQKVIQKNRDNIKNKEKLPTNNHATLKKTKDDTEEVSAADLLTKPNEKEVATSNSNVGKNVVAKNSVDNADQDIPASMAETKQKVAPATNTANDAPSQPANQSKAVKKTTHAESEQIRKLTKKEMDNSGTNFRGY